MTAAFHPLAAAELTDAAVFYEGQAQGLGSDFLDEIERLVGLVSAYPDLGHPQPGDIRTIPARRFP
ncbi:MAG TPA: type II toxin-antitoxin system RelE/ParE family toxin [Gemmatimonadales bacterium]|nr:type II toxin-antitoxin system RelE/ParE family toxin [Gemmatimonadales bacterium]